MARTGSVAASVMKHKKQIEVVQLLSKVYEGRGLKPEEAVEIESLWKKFKRRKPGDERYRKGNHDQLLFDIANDPLWRRLFKEALDELRPYEVTSPIA